MTSEFRAGSRPLFAATLGTAFGSAPVVFNVVPLIIGPIHAEFGWDFKWISGGITLWGLIGALLAPLYGALCDRLGVRKVALWSLFAFGVIFSAFWAMPGSLPGYYGLWILLGLVAIGTSPISWSRAVSLWFVKRRGAALGIMLLGTSLSGLIAPQVARAAIEAGGWRLVFPAAAALSLFVALPIGLLWFREPRPEERPAALLDASGQPSGRTLREAARDYRFWLLFVSVFAVAVGYGGAYIHLGQIVMLHGQSPAVAATVITMLALGILSGRLLVGVLFDYLWAPLVALPTLVLGAIGCVLLTGDSASVPLLLAAGFMLGLSSGGETDLIAYVTARYFGMAHYGRIYGMLYMPFALGASVSPFIYGAVRDATGGYDVILAVAAGLFVVGGGSLLALGRYPVQAPAAAG